MQKRACSWTLFIILVALAGALACAGGALPTRTPAGIVPPFTPPPAPAGNPLPTNPAPATSPTTGPVRITAATGVPAGVITLVQDAIADANPVTWTGGPDADVTLTLDGGQPVATWVYAVAAPFPTVRDGVTLDDVQAAWRGEGEVPLLVTADAAAVLTALWGEGAAEIVPAGELVDTLWQSRPAWTILPFPALTPRLKVLRVEGQSPLDGEFDPAGYPLTVRVGLAGDGAAVQALAARLPTPATNRDPGRLTRVAMTGVTALVRATATEMEQNGILYPGEAVRPVLRGADIAHVSNEVSFTPTAECPPPSPIGGTTFCSDERYFTLLEDIGVDVVELTGNHLDDWGAEYVDYSLDLYDAAGMKTFGGGRDLAAAAEPALFTHNGNAIAFVGCNPVGPSYAWATPGRGGSLPCDDATFAAQIGTLRDEGAFVIATQQYLELYQYPPSPQQRADFRALAEAGAGAVSGSQGHHAQGFDFHDGAFIHYGLGNLFFDQMDRLGTRQTFVDVYVIYEGRLLSVDLWTGLIENFARPRPMTPDERAQLLQTVFQASGW